MGDRRKEEGWGEEGGRLNKILPPSARDEVAPLSLQSFCTFHQRTKLHSQFRDIFSYRFITHQSANLIYIVFNQNLTESDHVNRPISVVWELKPHNI